MYYQDGKYLKTLYLTSKQWDQRLINIFNRNIKKYHKSISIAGIANYMYDCIIESESDTGNVLIAVDRYKELYKTAGICKS